MITIKKSTHHAVTESFVKCSHVKVESLVNYGPWRHIFRIKFILLVPAVLPDEVGGGRAALVVDKVAVDHGWKCVGGSAGKQIDLESFVRPQLISQASLAIKQNLTFKYSGFWLSPSMILQRFSSYLRPRTLQVIIRIRQGGDGGTPYISIGAIM